MTAKDWVIRWADKMSNVGTRMCPPPTSRQSPCAAGPKMFTFPQPSSISHNQTFYHEDREETVATDMYFPSSVSMLGEQSLPNTL